MKDGFFRAKAAFREEKAETIASGYYHNLAVTAGGDLYSWGCGTFPEGQGEGSKPALGQGVNAEDKGAFPAQVPGVSEVADVAAGAYHSVALTKAGEVLTFGAGQLGQLGRRMPQGETDASGLPIDATPRPVEGLPGGETNYQIGAGFYNTFVVCRKSGRLYCSGENQNTQCGFQRGVKNLEKMSVVNEVGKDHIVAARGGYCHTLVLARGGKVLSLGCGDDGQRGDGRAPEDPEREMVSEVVLPRGAGAAVDIAAGANHSLVLDKFGRVYGFGSNEYGQLGAVRVNEIKGKKDGTSDDEDYGDDDDDGGEVVLRPTRIPLPPGSARVASISAGYAHTVLTCEDGTVLAFGQNGNGQLGADPEALQSSSEVVELTT